MRRSFFVLAALFWFGAGLVHDAGAQTDSELETRMQRLEEQIVDLSAQLGTIETMAQSGGGIAAAPAGGASFGGGGGGGDDGRLSLLETQIRALSSQLSDIQSRLDRIEQRSGGLPGGAGRDFGSAAPEQQGTGFSVGGNDPASSGGGFGTTIESDGGAGDPAAGGSSGLGGFFDQNSRSEAPSATLEPQPVRTAAQSSPEAESLYKKGYDALVQRDYRAAADNFQQFVGNFPADPLAGAAYHWLGEAAFINGEYRMAADSFLKSSTNYPQNEQAPESLLKLGIALKRLGENNAACSSFAELSRRFPNATPVLERAEREKSRTQC
ncbi:MAG: tol-pal system protein YbgF [Rhodomicrobiaceae bacterium]